MIDTDTAVLETLGLAGVAAAPQSGSEDDLGRTDFLELMLAQIKHQDPLNPLEGEEFVAQLAQFSMVQGIEELNASFASVASALQSDQLLQASALVGKQVLVASDVGYLGTEGGLTGQVELPLAVPDLTISIYDQAGQLVRTLSLGAREPGMVEFTWEGVDDGGSGLAPGIYRIAAEGTVDDRMSAFSTFGEFTVDSAVLDHDSESILLNLAGIGEVPFDRVLEIR